MTGGEALEVQPPDFNRLKCKPVSSAVRKQIEIFVPLVPYRARRFSWTRFRTVDTLDAEQDPRRRHEPDTVFFVCGFNTMGEFSVVSGFSFSFLFFSLFFFLLLVRDASERSNGKVGKNTARFCLWEMFWRVVLAADPAGKKPAD